MSEIVKRIFAGNDWIKIACEKNLGYHEIIAYLLERKPGVKPEKIDKGDKNE